MNTTHLLTISGSLRKDSFNSALLRAVEAQMPGGITVEHARIGDLPLYNQDDEKERFSKEAAELKAKIRAADGIIIATPEYNRSVPGVLKNALDWTSRPYGDNAWAGKPVYVMGMTGGAVGTALAQADLKKILLYLDAHVLGQPEFYGVFATEKFDAEGNLTDEKTKEVIAKALTAFVAYIGKFR